MWVVVQVIFAVAYLVTQVAIIVLLLWLMVVGSRRLENANNAMASVMTRAVESSRLASAAVDSMTCAVKELTETLARVNAILIKRGVRELEHARSRKAPKGERDAEPG